MALIQCDFFAETLGLSGSMNVILPQPPRSQSGPAGAAGGAPRYPVLFLLHGLSDDHSTWLRRTSIERYAAPLGLAVVMPAVQRSFYTDMACGRRNYWQFIREELPALCRHFFPLSERREDTFAAGLSMGGLGAFKLALNCPETFAAAGSFSGALDMADVWHRQALDNDDELRACYGSPQALRGSPDDLFAAATKLAATPGPKPRLFQCCGTEDFLYPDNLRFRDHARALGLPLTYEDGPGTHEWGYWDAAIQRFLAWLPLPRP